MPPSRAAGVYRRARASALLAVFLALPVGAAPEIVLEVDDRFPARVLALFDSDSVDAGALEEIAALPGARALIRKVHGYAPEADAALLQEALRRAHTGQKWDDDPFYFWHSRRQREKTAALLAGLRSRDGLAAGVTALLAPYLPDDLVLETTIVLVVGGASAGWTLGDGNFQIGLDHHADDPLELLERSAAHEVYHVVQEALLPPPPDDGDDPQDRVDMLLRALVMEGTASLLDDFTSLGGDGELLTTLREKQERNRARLDAAFLLFETLALRTAHDTDADLGLLYEIGFLDPWDSTSYEVGRTMAEAIVAADGPAAIPALVRQGPRAFVRRYVALCRERTDLRRFTPTFERLVEAE